MITISSTTSMLNWIGGSTKKKHGWLQVLFTCRSDASYFDTIHFGALSKFTQWNADLCNSQSLSYQWVSLLIRGSVILLRYKKQAKAQFLLSLYSNIIFSIQTQILIVRQYQPQCYTSYFLCLCYCHVGNRGCICLCMYNTAIISTLLFVILLLALCCLRKRIQIAIALIKVASK